jgi:pimeloyl-ACP methyl ester carboxylesterase
MIEHTFLQANGIRLHVALSGPREGLPVLLLHGFPEMWMGWRKQIPALAGAGYRVIAPDQRGYNLSDKPRGIAAYKVGALAADITGLMDTLGYEQAAIVGHDWGAYVAWWLAMTQPQRVRKLGILNVPHPAVVIPQALRHPTQFVRSLYALFFQLPRVPEALLSRKGYRPMAEMLVRTSRPGAFSETDLQGYMRAWSQPNALTSMLNWYRANFRRLPDLPPYVRVTMPALMLWGVQDVALGRYLAQPSTNLCNQGRLVFFEQATHWVQHEEADRVNALLIEFLR